MRWPFLTRKSHQDYVSRLESEHARDIISMVSRLNTISREKSQLESDLRHLRSNLRGASEAMILPDTTGNVLTIYPVPEGDFTIDSRGDVLRLRGIYASAIHIEEAK